MSWKHMLSTTGRQDEMIVAQAIGDAPRVWPTSAGPVPYLRP